MRCMLICALVCALTVVLQPRTTGGETPTQAIYVVDRGNRRIVRMDDMSGAGWTVLGKPDPYRVPEQIVVDGAGRVYVTYPIYTGRVVHIDDRIYTLDPQQYMPSVMRLDNMEGTGFQEGWVVPEWVYDSRGRAVGLKRSSPDGIAVDPKTGRIYLLLSTIFQTQMFSFEARAVDFRIAKLGIAPLPWEFGSAGHGRNQFWFPKGIFLDDEGQIYVADAGNNRIVRLLASAMDGTGWQAIGRDPSVVLVITFDISAGAGDFNEPSAVAVDAANHIVVLDSGHHRVTQMDTIWGHGWITLGSEGGGKNQFRHPHGLALDAVGRIYVADTENDRIVRVDNMSGAGWTVFGTSGGGVGQFTRPSGISVGPRGR